eukprot:gene12642-13940_t
MRSRHSMVRSRFESNNWREKLQQAIYKMETQMKDALGKVNLSHLEGNFNREKITPDLVGKLSLIDLQRLGLTNRKKIMDLRIECASFGSNAPEKTQFCGAPKYRISKNTLEEFVNSNNLILSPIVATPSLSNSLSDMAITRSGDQLSFPG